MHGEKTASLCLYEGSRGFYCFGCHEGGDAIRLYKRLFGLTAKEAALRLVQEFSPEGNPSPPPAPARRQSVRRHAGRLMDSAVCGVLHRAQSELAAFTPADADDPAFTRALRALADAQNYLNMKEELNDHK